MPTSLPKGMARRISNTSPPIARPNIPQYQGGAESVGSVFHIKSQNPDDEEDALDPSRLTIQFCGVC